MLILLSALLAALTLPSSGLDAVRDRPVAIFTTWSADPTTTVTIDWHLDAGTDVPALSWRRAGSSAWSEQPGRAFPFPHSTRTVRRAQLTELEPDALYEIRIGDSPLYRYRTMPRTLTRPIVFATGGDTQADDRRFGAMNRMVASHNVDFVVIGGDLAYSNGDPRLSRREEEWFETVTNSLVSAEGRLIPVVAAIGNHETFLNADTSAANRQMVAETGVRMGDATYYGVLHARPEGPHYRAIDVGDYVSFLLLDTDHTAPVAGVQTAWLQRALQARSAVPFVFPVYHVPAYPSVRAFSGTTSARVRTHWAPAFEAAGVRAAFENHDHAYKRTHPLRAGRSDPTGVTYIGDGAWGVGVRALGQYKPEGEALSHMAMSQSVNHAILVTLRAETAELRVLDADGGLIDRVTIARR